MQNYNSNPVYSPSIHFGFYLIGPNGEISANTIITVLSQQFAWTYYNLNMHLQKLNRSNFGDTLNIITLHWQHCTWFSSEHYLPTAQRVHAGSEQVSGKTTGGETIQYQSVSFELPMGELDGEVVCVHRNLVFFIYQC